MNGSRVDMTAVHWLWVCTVNGEFGSATPSEQVSRQALQGVDKEVAASLAMLLGSEISRQASIAQDSIDRQSLRRWDSLSSLRSTPSLSIMIDNKI